VTVKLGNTSARMRSSFHDWTLDKQTGQRYYDELHTTITTSGGGVKESIHMYYDGDLNYLGMSVFVNGAHDRNLSEGK
jgi:hypothetical protein